MRCSMTPIRIITVDAFTECSVRRKPGRDLLLDVPQPEEWLRNVAREMNLSETAFLVPHNGDFELRWLTPTVEVDLCGHATIAARTFFGRTDMWLRTSRFVFIPVAAFLQLIGEAGGSIGFPGEDPDGTGSPHRNCCQRWAWTEPGRGKECVGLLRGNRIGTGSPSATA